MCCIIIKYLDLKSHLHKAELWRRVFEQQCSALVESSVVLPSPWTGTENDSILLSAWDIIIVQGSSLAGEKVEMAN